MSIADIYSDDQHLKQLCVQPHGVQAFPVTSQHLSLSLSLSLSFSLSPFLHQIHWVLTKNKAQGKVMWKREKESKKEGSIPRLNCFWGSVSSTVRWEGISETLDSVQKCLTQVPGRQRVLNNYDMNSPKVQLGTHDKGGRLRLVLYPLLHIPGFLSSPMAQLACQLLKEHSSFTCDTYHFAMCVAAVCVLCLL